MPVSICSGRLLRRVLCVPDGFAGQALFVGMLASAVACGQTGERAAAKKTTAARVNELTLAGLRPGRDTLARAAEVEKQFGNGKDLPGEQTVWFDACRDISLTIDSDKGKQIEMIRVAAWGGSTADCSEMPPGPWKTGRGLRMGDFSTKTLQTYGEPDSRSPSTKEGEPLELWHYAFDWAGADVPQVMEVLCTREGDGKAGRVMEITLAAPSL
jgi:hypothetical protein